MAREPSEGGRPHRVVPHLPGFPEPHRRRIRTINGPERFNQELKRRTQVVRIFPNREACLRLMTALADLIFYTAGDASDITQMDYIWTIFVCYMVIPGLDCVTIIGAGL